MLVEVDCSQAMGMRLAPETKPSQMNTLAVTGIWTGRKKSVREHSLPGEQPVI